MQTFFREMFEEKETLDNFVDSIYSFGLLSFVEYGVAKSYIDESQIEEYVQFFMDVLVEKEMYEACSIVKHEYEKYFNKKLNVT